MTRLNVRSAPVSGIMAVDGWTLHAYDEWDSDGFWTDAWFARGAERDVALDVSRFHFSPSQERFAWLVRHDFPRRRGIGPWDDTEIEHEMACEQRRAA